MIRNPLPWSKTHRQQLTSLTWSFRARQLLCSYASWSWYTPDFCWPVFSTPRNELNIITEFSSYLYLMTNRLSLFFFRFKIGSHTVAKACPEFRLARTWHSLLVRPPPQRADVTDVSPYTLTLLTLRCCLYAVSRNLMWAFLRFPSVCFSVLSPYLCQPNCFAGFKWCLNDPVLIIS